MTILTKAQVEAIEARAMHLYPGRRRQILALGQACDDVLALIETEWAHRVLLADIMRAVSGPGDDWLNAELGARIREMLK